MQKQCNLPAHKLIESYLVAGFNPFDKYARQIWESSPILGVKIKKYLKPPNLVTISFTKTQIRFLTSFASEKKNATRPKKEFRRMEFFPHPFFLSKIWVFPKIEVPQNGWFIRENPIKMDDLGVPLFLETSICGIIR